MTDRQELIVGAVAYSANVVPIWEGIREYFADSDAPMDFVLFSNYERQVEALLAGHIDIAWNTNVAWIRALRRTGGTARAIATRNTDLVFTTVFVGRAGSGLVGLESLAGRRVALGSRDSGQARILAMHFLNRAGVSETDMDLIIFDSDVGKHGDTGRSDLDALRAVVDGDADAAAIGVNTWDSLRAGGDAATGDLEVIWESEHYSHCNFTILESTPESRVQPWLHHLLAMDWNNPDHRRILELEGLTKWELPDLSGYESLATAMDEQNISDHW